MILAGLVLASALEGPEILAIRCEPTAAGAVVKVLATSALAGAESAGAGERFVVSIPASLADGVALPEPCAPLLALSFEQLEGKGRLQLEVAAGTALELRTEGSLLELDLRAREAGAAAAAPRDVEQLFPLLFPGRQPRTAEPLAAVPEPTTSGGGIRLGPVALNPALVVRYVDADATFLETPTPVRARYLEIQPSLAATLDRGFFGGQLTASYEPRFRTSVERIPVLDEPSHFINVGLNVPVGSFLWFSATDQYSRGSIETQVVDPGREYFFDIQPFERNQLTLNARTETSSRIELTAGASFTQETLDPSSGYFDNDWRAYQAGLRYELTPVLSLGLGYEYEHVPPPDARPIVESTAHSARLSLEGELSASTRASAYLSYRRQDNPLAEPPGDGYRGVTFGGNLVRQMARGGDIRLGAQRATQLSAFEGNAFYLATGLQAAARVPLFWALEATGSASYQWNDYELIAEGLTKPRADELFGWTLGLARPLTRWSYLRADYSQDRRTSNVPGLSTRTHAFVLQLGLGGFK